MNNEAQPKIIGLSGTFASGKDTLSEFLVSEYNFLHIPTSQMLSAEALRTFGNTDRPAKAATAERLRKERGGGVLAKLALDDFAKHQQYAGVVVSGLRTMGEAEAIKHEGGKIVFVDASMELRYKRMTDRNRDAEAQITLEDFKQREQKEWHAGDSAADFNLRDIKASADLNLTNDSTYEDFIDNAKAGLKDLGIKL